MWSPFKKKPNVKSGVQEDSAKKKTHPQSGQTTPSTQATTPFGDMPDTKDMNMLQRFAMKRFMAMSPEEQKKMAEKMLTPKNVAKHKDEILAQLEQARKSGQMSDDQYRMAKRKLGL